MPSNSDLLIRLRLAVIGSGFPRAITCVDMVSRTDFFRQGF